MILAVIPARGGSKGIPRKNVRLLKEKPLIYYAISHAKECDAIDDVVVTSDDEEIRYIAEMYGADVIERDGGLAGDAVPLDPVIYDAVVRMEKKKGTRYDVVVTLQPTSPLLSVQTLAEALAAFAEGEWDTFISAVNRPHLSWGGKDGNFFPNYKERLNRQLLPADYLETGAFLITRRECVSEKSRIGKKVSVYEMPEQEAIDIDTLEDWFVCEAALKRKKIVFRADGYREIGMGHIYRSLTLAFALTGHEVVFATLENHKAGVEKLKESNMPVWECRDEADFFQRLSSYKPDIIVNDCLDTEADYIKRLKEYAPRVVTIEDLGPGAEYADVVINALYEDEKAGRGNGYYGEKYVCLRDEFIIAAPGEFREELTNILVVFGGADPEDFTRRIYRIAQSLHKTYPEITFYFVLGMAYSDKDGRICTREEENIYVYRDMKRISSLMAKADLAITSQGRTVYELAAMGTPAIVLAQNERETKHTFAQMKNGFLNLGLGRHVSDKTIENTLCWMIRTPQIRKEMQELMQQHDLKAGVERVTQLILGK